MQLYGYFLILSGVVFVGANSQHKQRTRRKVVFSKSSKFFFRLNGKDNMLNYTEIFAHGWTIRMNYDLPETIPKRHQFFKRDVHAELESTTDESVLNIYSCVLKYICEAASDVTSTDKCGIFCGIGKIISSTATMESQFFKTFLNKCDYHVRNCPYLFQNSQINYG